jgi:hypothetical protein
MVVAGRLARLVFLLAELALASVRRRSLERTSGTIFYDSTAASLDSRLAYLHYHVPGERFRGISYQSRIVAVPSPGDALLLVLRLGLWLLHWALWPSELGNHYFRIVRTCLLVHGHVVSSSQPMVYLFQLYRTEMTFLAAYLRERGVFVNLIPSTTPLTTYNKRLIGDSLKICNPYQIDEFLCYRDLGVCKHYEMWSPEEIHLLAPYYASRKIAEYPDTIGLYTQGFWLPMRQAALGEQMGEQLARREKELVDVILIYLQANPSLKVIIFPHPAERRQFAQTGEHQFDVVQQHKQVLVDFAGESSIFSFDRVGLGLTTVSTVGFDRIFMGFRTLFYIPRSRFLNPEIDSRFNALFVESEEQLLIAIDRVRAMSHTEFMRAYFGGFFWSPQG